MRSKVIYFQLFMCANTFLVLKMKLIKNNFIKLQNDAIQKFKDLSQNDENKIFIFQGMNLICYLYFT